MPIECVIPGCPPTVNIKVPCTKKALVTVIVLDEDPMSNDIEKLLPPLRNLAIDCLSLTDQVFTVQTDAEGHLTAFFDSAEAEPVRVRDKKSGILCRMGAYSKVAESASHDLYRVYAYLSKLWTIEVYVHDIRPPALNLPPVTLPNVPLRFQWDAVALFSTGDNGEPFTCDTMDVGVEYQLEAIVRGCRSEKTTFKWSSTVNTETIVGSKNDAFNVRVSVPRVRVIVYICLTFDKVLIVGEGTDFQYAIPLANKYKFTGPKKSKGTVEEILGKQTPRYWIFATQYDVDPMPHPIPDNLFIYPIAGNRQFDVTNRSHWQNIGQLHGTDFRDVIFNNPHPGYGLHACEVMGVDPGKDIRYRFVSVHSIGDQRLVTIKEIGDLLSSDWDNAALQKRALLTLGIDRDGGDTIGDYTSGSRETRNIEQLFESPQKAVAFRQRNTHYTPFGYIAPFENEWTLASSVGLKQHILTKYFEYGPSVLRSDGGLRINGSKKIEEDLADAHIERFEDDGQWKEGDYYVQYQSNFTHDRQHPSWFAKKGFNPEEPNIERARIYKYTKP